jgi:hypothetical protein
VVVVSKPEPKPEPDPGLNFCPHCGFNLQAHLLAYRVAIKH